MGRYRYAVIIAYGCCDIYTDASTVISKLLPSFPAPDSSILLSVGCGLKKKRWVAGLRKLIGSRAARGVTLSHLPLHVRIE